LATDGERKSFVSRSQIGRVGRVLARQTMGAVCVSPGRRTMNTMKYAVAVALALIAFVAPRVRAETIVFDASGTFSNSSLLSGTVTIDTAIGMVRAISLWTSGNVPTGPYLTLGMQICSATDCQVFSKDNAGDLIDLEIPTSTLLGYTGGPLCSLSFVCRDGVGDLTPTIWSTNSIFESGELSRLPEPSALSLLCVGIGLTGIGAIRRKRFA
jgi:hypothetical protein